MENAFLGTLTQVYRNLTRRKGRSFLTILGIAVGVAALVAIISTSRNLARAQERAYANSTLADLTYWVADAPRGIERILESIPNVAAVDLRNTYYTRARLGDLWYDVYFVGIEDFAKIEVNRFDLRQGTLPGLGEVLLEISARDLAPLEIGQEILVRAGPDQEERPLTISGFAQSPAQPSSVFLNLVWAYAPAAQVRQMSGTSGSNQVLAKLLDFGERNETIGAINRALDIRGIGHSEAEVRDPFYFEGKRELDALIQIMYAFSALGLLISAFLVANTLAAIVAEQTREIGIMKSIGGTRDRLLRMYLIAGGLYGFLGTLVGLLLGTGTSWILLRYAGWALNLVISPRPSWPGLAIGSALGMAASMLGSLGPARHAATISVRDALQSHGITSAYKQAWLDRTLERLRSVPPLVAMAARNLVRRTGRNLVTLLFTATATAAFLAAQSTGQSVNQAIAGIFATYRADAWVYLGEYVSNHFAASLEAMPEVTRAEAWDLADAFVDLAPVRLWGLPTDTELYEAEVIEGRWLRPGEPETAVVSTDLADTQGIRLGDTIEVDTGQVTRRFRVVGLAVDNAVFLGGAVAGKVFVPRETVERMTARQGRGYFFALALTPWALKDENQALNQIERKFRTLRPITESAQRDMASARQQSRLLSIALYVMTILIALAGGLGVMNTLTLNVLERRREIGVMRAIGASNVNLAQVFLTEGLSLGLLSGLLGIALSYPIGRLILVLLENVLFQIDYIYAPRLILFGVLFASLLATGASLLPALGAARLPAQEALRYE